MTKAVLNAVCPVLGINPDELILPDFSDEDIANLKNSELLG